MKQNVDQAYKVRYLRHMVLTPILPKNNSHLVGEMVSIILAIGL